MNCETGSNIDVGALRAQLSDIRTTIACTTCPILLEKLNSRAFALEAEIANCTRRVVDVWLQRQNQENKQVVAASSSGESITLLVMDLSSAVFLFSSWIRGRAWQCGNFSNWHTVVRASSTIGNLLFDTQLGFRQNHDLF